MPNEIVTSSSSDITQLTDRDIQIIKDTICKEATNQELALFVKVCNQTGLNPFMKQIYAIKRYDSKLQRNVVTHQVSIDGFRLIAERTGQYQGQDGPYWCGEDGVWVDVWTQKTPPYAAKVGIYKRTFLKPLYSVAVFHEYVQKDRSGNLSPMWKTMPDLMIAKCAEALALRRAFPAHLSGLYTTEEMQQADNAIDAEVIQEASYNHEENTHENKSQPSKEKMVSRIREMLRIERTAGYSNPVDEITTDFTSLSVEELIEIGKRIKARIQSYEEVTEEKIAA